MMRRITTLTKTRTELRLVPILLSALLAILAGCASDSAPVEEPIDTSEFQAEPPPPPPAQNVADTSVSNANVSIPPIYFDLDDSTIRSEFEGALRAGATALRASGASITIEGHCDERGSDEYNVALGERRANAVRSYLYNLGVPSGQMNAVSYGEAQPAVSGTGETAWQLNRRAQVSVR